MIALRAVDAELSQMAIANERLEADDQEPLPQCMDRRDGEPERLEALVKGDDWAPMGTSAPTRVPLMNVRTAS